MIQHYVIYCTFFVVLMDRAILIAVIALYAYQAMKMCLLTTKAVLWFDNTLNIQQDLS